MALLFGLPQVSFATELIGSTNTPPHVNEVHRAYLSKDFLTMTTEIKNALLASPNDPTVQQNVFDVYKQAASMQGEAGLPVDWHIPSEIKKMKIVSRRYDGPAYALKVQGNLINNASIEQLRVVHYSDQSVLIDKQAGIGGWMQRQSTHTHDVEYWSESHQSSSPLATGLYLINVALKDGKTVDGWFLIDDEMNPTKNPDVAIPSVGEEFQTGNPTFQWTDFRSPQYKSFEERSLWIGIYDGGSTKNETIWTLFITSPSLQQATIGGNTGSGVNVLDGGQYKFGLGYAELRHFGDILLGRECTTGRMFSVQGAN